MKFATASAVSISLFLATAAFPYVRSDVGPGRPFLFRPDVRHVQYFVNLARGSSKVSGSDADIMSALQSAANTWSSISGTTIHFNPIQSTNLIANPDDGRNVISFETDASTTSIVKDALAVTFTYYLPDGTLTDSDIVFDPTTNFSTTPSDSTTDLQSVATHEMGHALGFSHSGVYGATMFYSTGDNETNQRWLSDDDVAMAREAYPAPGGPAYGRFTGQLHASGGGLLRGGLVTAVEPATGVVVGGISSMTNASYSFQAPVGNYLLYAEPIAGQLSPDVFSLSPVQISTNFQAGFYGNNSNPVFVLLAEGAVSTIDITPPGGKSGITVKYGHLDPSAYFTGGPQVIPSGQQTDLEIAGAGVDSLTEQDIRVVGPASVHPGSVIVESPLSGTPVIRMTLDVPPRTNIGLASLFLSHGGSTTAYSGALILTPAKPVFTSAGVVNAFTFTGSNIAPGEDISIFGASIGPANALANTPDATGTYSTSLGGVGVTFDGQPAPLFYVSQGQINVQAPVELAGKTSTQVVVNYGGAQSDAVNVAVAPISAGLYPTPVNDDDGRLNSAQHAAKRGSYILLYGTGQGLVNPSVGTGKAAPSPNLAYAGPTTVTIGGQTVTPYFSGLAPGFVGLWQISVQIPPGLPPGIAQVSVTVNGSQTAPISVSVQ